MNSIAIPQRQIAIPRFEFPVWVRKIGDPLKMLSGLAGGFAPLGASVMQIPILDTVSGAAAAFSLRRLRTAYAGSAALVRRASDDTEQDIGFVGNSFDTSAFSTFVGMGSGFIKTWYDQSGNSKNVTQSTKANQPQILLNVKNGNPAVFFDGTNDYLAASGILIGTTSKNWTVYILYSQTTTPASSQAFFGQYPGGINYTNHLCSLGLSGALNLDEFDPSGGALAGGSLSTGNWYVAGFCLLDPARSIRVNGSQVAGDNSIEVYSGSTPTVWQIGARLQTAGQLQLLTGYLPEEILFSTSPSVANQAVIEKNINAYYAVY